MSTSMESGRAPIAGQTHSATAPQGLSGDKKWQQYIDQSGMASSVGGQITTHHYIRQALIEAAKDQLFTQMSSSINLPKNSGKEVKRNLYRPILSDFNLNDQGLDIAGADITMTAADKDDDNVAYEAMHGKLVRKDGETEVAYKTRLATLMAKAATKTSGYSGNLWGASKAQGIIKARLPKLTENGGRVNRVGVTRVILKSSLENYGFFAEYNQDSLDFDTDAQLEMCITRELVRTASEVYEATLQADIQAGAGVRMYANGSVSLADLANNNAAGNVAEVTYTDLMRLGIVLDQNRCPLDTAIISGSSATDTKVVGAARYAYIDASLLLTLRTMTDPFGNKAFTEVEKYAKAGNVAHGEQGAIGNLRFIVHNEMQHLEGVGTETAGNASAPAATLFHTTGGKFDAYPILVVGSDSFNTISFKSGRTSGGSKLEIIHKRPGVESADRNDPFGKTGFMSIQWWYGSLINRPEHIAVLYTIARV